MTFPTVTSITSSGSDSGTTHAVNYPASGINAGDLLLLFGACDGSGDQITLPAGDFLTNLISSSNSNSHGKIISYAIADGTENGGSFNVTVGSTEGVTVDIIHIENWHGTTPPEQGAIANGSAATSWGAANALNPTGWDVADDTLWFSLLTMDASTETVIAYPNLYTGNQTSNKTGSNSGWLAYATRNLATDSEGSAEKTSAISGAGVSKSVFMIAVRGAVGGAVISTVDSPVLDAEQDNALTTSGYGSDINDLTIETSPATNELDVSVSIAGTSGSFTFDMPDVANYTIDVLGTPFDTSSWTHTITASDGVDSDTEVIVVNPKAGWAVVEAVSPVKTEGSVFENFIGTPVNTDQVYYPTANNTSVAADGTLTTDQLFGTIRMIYYDTSDSTWKPFDIVLTVSGAFIEGSLSLLGVGG